MRLLASPSLISASGTPHISIASASVSITGAPPLPSATDDAGRCAGRD